ncbi:HNH endonuclease [Paucibacter sp. O1-1]|nr:HNH endonuclease [Paucibacter sp. O1-1]MDA3827827.1 HNH endonuclease [Paucibacter sp. O1-1]
MRDHGTKFSSPFWTDGDGTANRVLAPRRLDYSQPGPAHLRRFVMKRDGERCVICGSGADLVIDHEVSLKNGGTNHPANLRVLCGTCNCRKAGLFDATNAAAKPHLAGVDWMAWLDGNEVRYGLILGGRSVRFRLPKERAAQLANAILKLTSEAG